MVVQRAAANLRARNPHFAAVLLQHSAVPRFVSGKKASAAQPVNRATPRPPWPLRRQKLRQRPVMRLAAAAACRASAAANPAASCTGRACRISRRARSIAATAPVPGPAASAQHTASGGKSSSCCSQLRWSWHASASSACACETARSACRTARRTDTPIRRPGNRGTDRDVLCTCSSRSSRPSVTARMR